MYSLTPDCGTVLERFLEPLLFPRELWPVSRSDSPVVQFEPSFNESLWCTEEVTENLVLKDPLS